MLSILRHEPLTFSEQSALALLLVLGLYFPTSINGEHSVRSILVAFALLFVLLAYLAWRHGVFTGHLAFISLPIMIVLIGCSIYTILARPTQLDAGLFAKFSALVLVFALDLRSLRLGAAVSRVLTVVNLLNILMGVAILVGSQWIADFLPRYYWLSDDSLLPGMLMLHKPVLTFGTHSLAGLYLYLFFFVNWEDYRFRRRNLALIFAVSYFVMLLGLTSFTSLALGGLALVQMALWLWKYNRRLAIVGSLSIVAAAPFLGRYFADQVGISMEMPQLGKTFLNSELSGPLSRFGPGGELQGEIGNLLRHPFSPIGLARSESAFAVESPGHFYIGDSGPLEYLTRGSIPLLLLIYGGLYLFLHRNLAYSAHCTTIFLVILAFETGFSALGSSRTYFLLPFFVVYLNSVVLPFGRRKEEVAPLSVDQELPLHPAWP